MKFIDDGFKLLPLSVRLYTATSETFGTRFLSACLLDENTTVRAAALKNPCLDRDVLQKALWDENCPLTMLEEILTMPDLSKEMFSTCLFFYMEKFGEATPNVIRLFLKRLVEFDDPSDNYFDSTGHLMILRRIIEMHNESKYTAKLKLEDLNLVYTESMKAFDRYHITQSRYDDHTFILLTILLSTDVNMSVKEDIAEHLESVMGLTNKAYRFLVEHAEETGAWGNIPSTMRVRLFYNKNEKLERLRAWVSHNPKVWTNDLKCFLVQNDYPFNEDDAYPLEWVQTVADAHFVDGDSHYDLKITGVRSHSLV